MTKRLRQHTNPLAYQGPYRGPAPAELLGGPPTELEIGPGYGELLVARARMAPAARILAVEVRRAYVDLCTAALAAAGLRNAVAIYAEARCDVPTLVAAGSLDIIYVMFGDPWFKRRHHKRRVVEPEFAALLTGKLKPGGELHVATDNQQLYLDMREALAQVGALTQTGEVPWSAGLSGRGLHHQKRGDTIYGGLYTRQR